ncbi:hypothetical protein B1C78_15805 [Thioalkalivibrio denitrificans]|uniref:DUF1499 domain-containing protein n=1 Tax=Thioalkalivibrio denitrificans TaxID=108003 RepID=A0A1V3NA92_9GAMM|nr:DUF1499 domain-containing protein [Thioalkalivibrio denitrificans]OOG21980.1 hypothetical protein B1C78_15805 [Thioalkalivibrio denitrificans]
MKHGAGLARAAAVIAVLVLVAGALLMAGSGMAYRAGLLPLGTAFDTLRYGVFTAMGAGVLGIVILLVAGWGRRIGSALTGALVAVGAAAMLAVPYGHWQQAQRVPPIHDITTDMRDPPAFVALVEARERAPNAVDYPGEDTARQQREAYPDIGPLRLRAPLSTVREAVVEEVHAQGWELAAVSGERIEATATTRWFGFRDDVVIRLREENDSVRVDMRSASRVGRSDVGANAARIRAYLDALERRVAVTD